MLPAKRPRLALVLVAGALPACSAILGLEDGTLRPDAGPDGSVATDGASDAPLAPDGTVDGHVPGDGSSPAEASLGDERDDDVVQTVDGAGGPDASDAATRPDAPDLPTYGDGGLTADGGCEAINQVADGSGIFVATDGSDGPSCGSRVAPCLTIGQGLLNAAAASKPVVYVAQGTYVEALTLNRGVTIVGGWTTLDIVGGDVAWSRACSSASTIIQAPPGASAVVVAQSLGGAAKLSTLTLRSKAQADVAPGESLYGVLASGGTNLTLVAVTITLASGGSGTAGAPGTDGTAGGSTCTVAGDGATPPSSPGKAAGGPAGTFGLQGYTAGNGTPGAPGSPGSNGTAGSAPTCIACVACSGSLTCSTAAAPPSCGAKGTVGCAGGGGGGGGAGSGGGSSVGVLAWGGAAVTAMGGSIQAGDGGSGAAAGKGGQAGKGGNGTRGAASTNACATACQSVAGLLTCSAVNQAAGQGGSAGGPGGSGVAGGAGGDGAGGNSYAVVTGGNGTFTPSGTTLLSGNPGQSAGNGASGHAGQTEAL